MLASRSPRRRELLKALGISFEVLPAQGEERPYQGEGPARYALELACAKAREVASLAPGKVVLAADTIVVSAEEILGKPKDEAEAKRMLSLLSGREHEVLTAYVILDGAEERRRVVSTRVLFKELCAEEVEAYLATGEPWDKAGAYAIQGIASYMVKEVHGSVTNVIGLPLAEVTEDLLKLGVITWERPDGDR